jgi:hypothetical protein
MQIARKDRSSPSALDTAHEDGAILGEPSHQVGDSDAFRLGRDGADCAVRMDAERLVADANRVPGILFPRMRARQQGLKVAAANHMTTCRNLRPNDVNRNDASCSRPRACERPIFGAAKRTRHELRID